MLSYNPEFGHFMLFAEHGIKNMSRCTTHMQEVSFSDVLVGYARDPLFIISCYNRRCWRHLGQDRIYG